MQSRTSPERSGVWKTLGCYDLGEMTTATSTNPILAAELVAMENEKLKKKNE